MKFEHLNIEIGEPVIPKNQVKFEVKESLESENGTEGETEIFSKTCFRNFF